MRKLRSGTELCLVFSCSSVPSGPVPMRPVSVISIRYLYQVFCNQDYNAVRFKFSDRRLYVDHIMHTFQDVKKRSEIRQNRHKIVWISIPLDIASHFIVLLTKLLFIYVHTCLHRM